ncbi:MAG: response regulator [Chroococcus sp. CMT-3BRIN-NPC107]|jgi:signal transduction histidine kinase/DNA-binding response OmpR family regulator/HPt (histidine-containing phosphotransfer) domain-containing protein|nr:response regulator [Chroococcus sp. CMT-3BRIN-NPC107]
MAWRINLKYLKSLRRHPDFFPTFAPVLLGLVLLFVLLAILDRWTATQVLGLVLLLFCSMLPISALSFGLILLLLIISSKSGLLHLIELSAIATSSIFLVYFLRPIEWRLASQSVLSSLSDRDTTTPIALVTKATSLLRNFTRADVALALRQIDDVTAVAIAQLPQNVLPNSLTNPALYADAIAINRCLYYPNYPSTPNAARTLLAIGTKSLAVLPLVSTDGRKGAILLIWYQPNKISFYLRQFTDSLVGNLRTLLKFNDLTISLDKLQARFGAMLETIPQGVVFIDESGEQGWINQAAARQLQLNPGYVEPPILAQAMAALRMSAENQAEITTQAQQFFSQPQSEIRNWNWIIGGEQPKVLSVSSTPTRTGDVPGKLWLFDDISEQYFGHLALIATNKELEQAKVAAESATRIKSQFLANMSHEIRTPMNAIVGLTDVLLQTPLTSQQRDFINTIQVSSDSLLMLINDILDLAKIESGKVELEKYAFNLGDFVAESLDLIAFKAAEKNLELACLINPDVPNIIVTDVTRLRQILVNLLSNAVKFTASGEIIVSVAARQLQEQAEDTNYEFLFAVKDTGIGVSKEQEDRLFKSFSQADSSTTRKYGGTGLGLAIGKQLSEKMGGKMWFESEVNGGSTFYFTITAPAKYDLAIATDKGQLQGKHLLIVDDNATNRQILVLQAQNWQMLPVAVESGAEALKLLQQQNYFELAILDMQMPQMDGLTLAREIQHQLKLTNLPLVMLASIDKANVIDKTFPHVNFAAVISKPIKQAYLYNVLNQIFSKKTVPLPNLPTKQNKISDRLTISPLQILLAEDNIVNQKVALHLLQQIGYTADVANDGLEVIAALKNRPYDVVLMDVQMPKMDGLEATRQIVASNPIRPRIIAMTANAMQGDREECLNAGMDDYLSKPIRLKTLATALNQCKKSNLLTALPNPIDINVMQEFKTMVGENAESVLVEIIHCYLEDAPKHLENIASAISQNNKSELRRAAHTLKSSSATLGATNLAVICQELETLSRTSHTEDGAHKLAQLQAEYEQVKTALRFLLR